ncbi:hypothetical protein [Bailinhaonella thermotolerans]|uniref:hypothetical protein n=1 Tax=Bailinhaonella thermotolerans TaxID=1070861 RepID=UPI0011C3B2DC
MAACNAVHGGAVELDAVGEAVQVRQVGDADGGDLGGELVIVAFSRGEERGEVADMAGEFGHLGTGGGEFPHQAGVAFTESVGVSEQQTCQAARVVTGRSLSCWKRATWSNPPATNSVGGYGHR